MITIELIINTLIEKANHEVGIVAIRSRFGKEYERPSSIKIKGRKKQFTPDLVVEYENRTDFYLVEQENVYDTEKLRLLSLYARRMRGNLYVLVPRDYEALISGKLEEDRISARTIPFSD